MAHFDVVLAGGILIDGSGSPARPANIAISAGKIAAVTSEQLQGARVIDVAGQVVAPGFIDLHSHADFTLQDHPAATSVLHQGVTTLVTGNCGWSPFPVGDSAQLRSWAGFLGPGLQWSWKDAAGFTAAQQELRPAVNVALQVGHSSLRLAVMGDSQRAASPAELRDMGRLLRDAAAAGAVGFSSGLIYAPGSFAPAGEVRALVSVAADCGLLYSTHMRNESAQLLEAVGEAIEAAESAGARLEISHLKAMGPANHGLVRGALGLIDEARERGVDVGADVYPYTASSTTLTSRLPGWALDGGPQALLARLAKASTRARIAGELRARFGHDIDPEGVVLAELGAGPYREQVGQSIAGLGRQEGIDPAEAALRVLEEHQGTVSIVNHAMSQDDVDTVMAHPQVAVASDGSVLRPAGAGMPHPRNFGTFPRVLSEYVRGRSVLPIEEAIRKMTSLPASRAGFKDRGLIAEGMSADVVVFDADRVADHSTYTDPWQLCSGISTVLVSGRPALDGGVVTDSRDGRILRS